MNILILKQIGSFTPLIFFFLSLLLLRKRKTLLFYYVIGICFNTIFNVALKMLIKQPRPNAKGRISVDKYGMPSGHAQSVFFTLVFLYFAFDIRRDREKYAYALLFYIVLTFITLIGRLTEKYHTLFQVVVGSLIGGIFGYVMYYSAERKLAHT